MPDYPATGKRTLQDNGSWLRTLTRDDVELVREGIDHIEADAVVTESGERHEVDVIVFATGFHANRFLWPMEVVGRDGARARRASGATSRRPTSASRCPRFPNLFCMYGPGTNLAHGGSLIFHSECQMRYIVGCIDLLLATGSTAMEPKPDVHDAYYERTQRELDGPRVVATVDQALVVQERRRAASTCSARGGSSTTGTGRRRPTPTTSRCAERQPEVAEVAPAGSRRRVKTQGTEPAGLGRGHVAGDVVDEDGAAGVEPEPLGRELEDRRVGLGQALRARHDDPREAGHAPARHPGSGATTSWGMFVSPNCGTPRSCSSSTISVVPGIGPPIIST